MFGEIISKMAEEYNWKKPWFWGLNQKDLNQSLIGADTSKKETSYETTLNSVLKDYNNSAKDAIADNIACNLAVGFKENKK